MTTDEAAPIITKGITPASPVFGLWLGALFPAVPVGVSELSAKAVELPESSFEVTAAALLFNESESIEELAACEESAGWDEIAGCELAAGWDELTGCELAAGWDELAGCELAGRDELAGCELAGWDELTA